MGQAAARFAEVKGSVVAQTKTLTQKMNETKPGWGWLAVTGAVACVPVIGVGISYGMDRYRNSATAKKQKEVLADHYANEVAATLGIPANKITGRELDMAARYNPMIDRAVAKVKQEEKNSNRAAALGLAGAYATGAAFAPVLGGVTNGLAHGAATMAVHMGGNIAGSSVSSVFDKPQLHVQDVMEILDAKHKGGEPITAQDVLMLRIAQDVNLQRNIRKHSDVAFHKMTPEQQQRVISQLPAMYWKEAKESAEKLASGQIKEPQALLAPAQYAANDDMGAANDNGGSSWRNRIDQQRAQAALTGAQRG